MIRVRLLKNSMHTDRRIDLLFDWNNYEVRREAQKSVGYTILFLSV